MKPIYELDIASIQYLYSPEFEKKWKSIALALMEKEIEQFLFEEEESVDS